MVRIIASVHFPVLVFEECIKSDRHLVYYLRSGRSRHRTTFRVHTDTRRKYTLYILTLYMWNTSG